jgi:GNAT superfamily N-acetyltransferase
VAAVDETVLHKRLIDSMFGTWRLIASGNASRAVERPGLLASIVPATPQRSVFNSVVYDDAGTLAASLDELARLYEETGVDAWTVWVPEADRDSARLLEQAGHHLDAEPRAMGMELSGFEEPDLAAIDWSDGGDLVALARINDVAYDHAPGTFEAGLAGVPAERVHVYEARLDGEHVAGLATTDFDGDCEIMFVATLPQARGMGLSTALMKRAMWDARERGCDTTTLQATKLGRPVYERLGYRDLGALQMWERRRS